MIKSEKMLNVLDPLPCVFGRFGVGIRGELVSCRIRVEAPMLEKRQGCDLWHIARYRNSHRPWTRPSKSSWSSHSTTVGSDPGHDNSAPSQSPRHYDRKPSPSYRVRDLFSPILVDHFFMVLPPTTRQLLRSSLPSNLSKSSSSTITTVSGWIESIRKQKNISFTVITDGSSKKGLQAVLVKKDEELLRRYLLCFLYSYISTYTPLSSCLEVDEWCCCTTYRSSCLFAWQRTGLWASCWSGRRWGSSCTRRMWSRGKSPKGFILLRHWLN